ncbi:hypothetical protein [Streptomyces cucumeris]|uniref:hypothetical protein n=1 Tax=Streptomyces cucumeris TaxID=2962890 RepID=UPI003D73BC72
MTCTLGTPPTRLDLTRAFSARRCPTVGISGLTLGGGFGFSSRKLGLTADALACTRAVTAAGNSLVCDDTTPVDTVAVHQLDCDWRDTPTAFAAVQALALGAPNTFSCRIGGGSAGRKVSALGRSSAASLPALPTYTPSSMCPNAHTYRARG